MRKVTDGIVFSGGLVKWWGQDCIVLWVLVEPHREDERMVYKGGNIW